CNEVIYGDMLLFEDDREILKSYQNEFLLGITRLPFNYLYKNGFSALLNKLASQASNNRILYCNTSEVIDEDYGISEILNSNPDCNAFFFTHRQERHRWF